MRTVLAAIVVALVAAVTALAAPPATQAPGQLTVGISMPSEGFQVGAVKGSQVVLARGFEIDLAKALATRLGLAKTVFVQSRFDRLFSAGAKPWDIAIAQITITPRRQVTADFTRPYLAVNQGVLVAQSLRSVPKTLAALRSLRLCALQKSTGADVVQQRIRPTKALRLIGNVPKLLLDLQTGRCDAVVYDAPPLRLLKFEAPKRYGPFAGVIRTGERYGIALPKGSALLKQVDKALAAIIADGTLERLERKWWTVGEESVHELR